MKWILIAIAYIAGMFLMKVIATIYDRLVTGQYEIGDAAIVLMFFCPIALPLAILIGVFYWLYRTAGRLGDELYEIFRR